MALRDVQEVTGPGTAVSLLRRAWSALVTSLIFGHYDERGRGQSPPGATRHRRLHQVRERLGHAVVSFLLLKLGQDIMRSPQLVGLGIHEGTLTGLADRGGPRPIMPRGAVVFARPSARRTVAG